MTRREHVTLLAVMALGSVATIATQPRRSGWQTATPASVDQVTLDAATPERELRVRIEVSPEGRATTRKVRDIHALLVVTLEYRHEGPLSELDTLIAGIEPNLQPWQLRHSEDPTFHPRVFLDQRWDVAGHASDCASPTGACTLETVFTVRWDGPREGTLVLTPAIEASLHGPSTARRPQLLPEGAEIRVLEAQWL